MYANLEVTVKLLGDTEPRTFYAHEVAIERPPETIAGVLVVKEDLNDGGSYAEPGPEHRFALGHVEAFSVGADF